MTEQPRKRKFQVHLSTALVLMFVAGALLGANLLPRIVKNQRRATFFNWYEGPTCFIEGRSYGWPLAAVLYYEAGPAVINPVDVSRSRIAFDAVFALIVVASILFACEQWIGRRDARRRNLIQ